MFEFIKKVVDNRKDKKEEKKEEEQRKEDLLKLGSSWDEDPRLRFFLALKDFNNQLELYKALPNDKARKRVIAYLMLLFQGDLATRLQDPFARFKNAAPTQQSTSPLTTTSPFAPTTSNNPNTKYLLIGGAILSSLILFKVLKK